MSSLSQAGVTGLRRVPGTALMFISSAVFFVFHVKLSEVIWLLVYVLPFLALDKARFVCSKSGLYQPDFFCVLVVSYTRGESMWIRRVVGQRCFFVCQ